MALIEDQARQEVPRIVVGVDGSRESTVALQWAATMAPVLNGVIIAITAWHVESVIGPYAASGYDPETDAQQVLSDALAAAFGKQIPDGLSSQCRRGQPAQILIELGKNAGMLVVGSRGHGGFAGLLLGSVSSACAEHAACPVLVVRGGPKAPVNSAVGEITRELAGRV